MEDFNKFMSSIDSFMFNMYSGRFVKPDSPKYNEVIDINIRSFRNNISGSVYIKGETIELDDSKYKKIYSYIEKNINKLVEISLNEEETEYAFGAADIIEIKYKSMYMKISSDYIDDRYSESFYNLIQDILKILTE